MQKGFKIKTLTIKSPVFLSLEKKALKVGNYFSFLLYFFPTYLMLNTYSIYLQNREGDRCQPIIKNIIHIPWGKDREICLRVGFGHAHKMAPMVDISGEHQD